MGVAVRATKATPEQCFIFGGKCHCSFLLATHCPCWRKASASQSAYTAASPLSKPISHAAAALHASAGGVSVGCSWNMPATFTAICPSWNILRASGDAHCSCRNKSEEHTSELQSLMRISYAVFCLKKKNTNNLITHRCFNVMTIHTNNRRLFVVHTD